MPRYSEEILDEIRSANDIVEVVSQYVTLKRSGRNFFGLCPFHKEKSPSFSVSPDKQIFHCFGCGEGGDVIYFISKIENISYLDAIQFLADRAHITLPTMQGTEDSKTVELKNKIYKINELAAEFYHNYLYSDKAKLGQEYVKKRKLDNKTLKKFKIGFSGTNNELYVYLKENGFSDSEILSSNLARKTQMGKIVDRYVNRLMFPIFDVKGKVIAFGGRVLDDSKPKYINSAEGLVYSKGRNLYGLNVAKNSSKKDIIIVEGYMDCVSLHQRGIDNAVASLGTALTEAQGRLLSRYAEKVIIGYDSDGAGQAATLRGLEILHNMGCDLRILQMEGAKDPDEYVIKYGSAGFENIVSKAISLVEFKIKVLKNSLNIESTNDKIKFLNEIAKILSNVGNKIEQEVYIDRISNEYKISKEAIYGTINKLMYSKEKGAKTLEKKEVIKKEEVKSTIDEKILAREKMLIWFLCNFPSETYETIYNNIKEEDILDEKHKRIIKTLYVELQNGNSNINSILDKLETDDVKYITGVINTNNEMPDIKKGLNDLIIANKKESLLNKKVQILKDMDISCTEEEKEKLENELNKVIIELAKLKN